MSAEEDLRIERFNNIPNLGFYIGFDFPTWLIRNGFFTAPASRRYHGCYEGGLFDHSICVADQLVKLTIANNLQWERDISPYIVGLFHDLCKIDQYKLNHDESSYEYNNDTLLKGHGDKSVMMLASHMQLTEEEVMCIRYHMGAFTDKEEWNDYTNAIHKYPNVLWTHHADMLASHVEMV